MYESETTNHEKVNQKPIYIFVVIFQSSRLFLVVAQYTSIHQFPDKKKFQKV